MREKDGITVVEVSQVSETEAIEASLTPYSWSHAAPNFK